MAPVAKKDHMGKIVSSQKDIKNLLLREYTNRLRSRPVREDLKSLKCRRQKIFEMKLSLSGDQSSSDWTMNDLEKALASLKNNKSRDPKGFTNELFKVENIGDNLKVSLLMMMNRIKKTSIVPEIMRYANITTIPKKGSRLELKNERGIFRCSVLRQILMRLIYNSKYEIIDKNMSELQMGARKNKGCRNNLFIINGIIHEVLRSKKNKPILLQIYDFAQMFDAIDLKEAISDIYDVGVIDDTLPLLYKANSEIFMSVKTQNGLTDRQTLQDIVLQGDTWGSILASNQVDKIGKACAEAKLGYMYKEELRIDFLAMVDDIICITENGFKAQEMNAIINTKSAEKSLQFGVGKCSTMLVGKCTDSHSQTNLSVDSWNSHYAMSGDHLNLIESFAGQTEISQISETLYLGFKLSSNGGNSANIKYVKNKSIGITRKLVSRLESLNLRKYFFEASVILKNSILRGSILYGCESYYDLKEAELRQFERIEETYMRKLLKTSRGCPIVQLYLELGEVPVRFQIMKIRLMFLKYIVEQESESIIQRFFNLQIKKPSKGDWASSCLSNLEELNISMSLEEIKNLSKYKFKNILNEKIQSAAFIYLTKKRGFKESSIEYKYLKMAEYLSPICTRIGIEEKRKMFAIRNNMVDIRSNKISRNEIVKCICGERETQKHIYECKMLNSEENPVEYEKIFNGRIEEQIEVFKRFDNNFQKYQLFST